MLNISESIGIVTRRVYDFIAYCLTFFKIVEQKSVGDGDGDGDDDDQINERQKISDDDEKQIDVMTTIEEKQCWTQGTQTDRNSKKSWHVAAAAAAAAKQRRRRRSSFSSFSSFSTSTSTQLSPHVLPLTCVVAYAAPARSSSSLTLIVLNDENCHNCGVLSSSAAATVRSSEEAEKEAADRLGSWRRGEEEEEEGRQGCEKKIKKTMEHLDKEQQDVMKHFDDVINEMDEKKFIQSISKSATETPVFVPPPPPVYEIEMTSQPLPRLSHLEKSSPTDEFGFNLHAERNRGHFIGTVDVGGIGERAGLRMGQRIVGVNGLLVYPNTPHKEVVALIKKKPLATTLLVASEDVDKWYRDNNVEYSFENSEKFGEAQPLTNQNDVEHQNHSKSNGFEVSAKILPNHNSHSIQVNEEHETKTTTIRKTEVTDSYQYKNPIASNPYSINNDDQEADLMSAVFQNVTLPETKVRTIGDVQVLSHTKELSDESRRSSISTVSTHRESAVDVPVNHKYIPSYTSPNQHQHHYEQNLDEHQRHIGTQQHQQPSPLSNGSSHGYAGGSTSGYDDDDIYHLTAREARERLRLKNRKHHLHDMSLNEKYQLVSNM